MIESEKQYLKRKKHLIQKKNTKAKKLLFVNHTNLGKVPSGQRIL